MSILIPRTKGVSADTLSNLENRFEKRLPQSYIAFLQAHDGAAPPDNLFQISKNNDARVERFISADECEQMAGTIEGLPKNVVLIAEATGGNFVYLNPDTGAIFFWDHEVDNDTKLADSFSGFIEMLQPFDPK